MVWLVDFCHTVEIKLILKLKRGKNKVEKSIEEMPKIFHSGYGYIPKSVMRCKNISIQAKAIYAYLISFAGRKSEAYPSRKLMCYDLNVSQDTLNKYLKELIEQKLISKT